MKFIGVLVVQLQESRLLKLFLPKFVKKMLLQLLPIHLVVMLNQMPIK